MKRITYINIFVFSLLTILTIANSVYRYKGFEEVTLIVMVLFFNTSLGILSFLLIRKMIHLKGTRLSFFLFYLILTTFAYWYILSTLLSIYYGSFLRLGGIYYFVSTRTWYGMLIFYLFSGFIIISLTTLFYYLSRNHYTEKPQSKKIRKRIKLLIVLTPIIIILSICNLLL